MKNMSRDYILGLPMNINNTFEKLQKTEPDTPEAKEIGQAYAELVWDGLSMKEHQHIIEFHASKVLATENVNPLALNIITSTLERFADNGEPLTHENLESFAKAHRLPFEMAEWQTC